MKRLNSSFFTIKRILDTKNDITITAGGAGTTVTGQFVVGLTLE